MNLNALRSISYGLYVIGSRKKEAVNAQIANTVIQISSDPPTILVCINKENLTHEFITSSKVYTVSILDQNTPLNFIGTFGFKSGRELDKFAGINYKIGETKAPIVLDNTLSYLEAKVVNEVDTKTHTIFIGELASAEVLKEGQPMTYAYYHQVKRGGTPKTAPSYIKESKVETKGDTKMAKYECTVCGYIYDPKVGDPDSNIPPGTPFEKLPKDWVCPQCGASKEDFQKMD